MGATSSVQQDSSEEDNTQDADQSQEPEEDSIENKLLQNNRQISNLNGKTKKQAEGQCEELDHVDEEDVPDKDQSFQEQESPPITDMFDKQSLSENEKLIKGEKEVNKLDHKNVGFKKTFRLGGFEVTLRKEKIEKTGEGKPATNTCNEKAEDLSERSEVITVEQEKHEIHTLIDEEDEKPLQMSEITEQIGDLISDNEVIEDVPDPEIHLCPIKRFIKQRVFESLKKKKKEKDILKDSDTESIKKMDNKSDNFAETAQEDTTCTCIHTSTTEEGKDLETHTRNECNLIANVGSVNSQEGNAVQASPFKRLFRKISTKRPKEMQPFETNMTESESNLLGNVMLSTNSSKLQKVEEPNGEKSKSTEEEPITKPEVSKVRSDSIVSWEALVCGGSLKKRSSKTSDSEDETDDKRPVTMKKNESPHGSSTDGDYNLTSSNEKNESPTETEDSTWKSLKKLVTPKRKSRIEDSLFEKMSSVTEITKDESSCSIMKLISGRKKIKPDSLQDYVPLDEASKSTGTDTEDDETPGLIPLTEYVMVENENRQEMTENEVECAAKKQIHSLTEVDKSEQTGQSVVATYDTRPVLVPITSVENVPYNEELTAYISKHQQLSDIPEEGTVASPVSFAEWTNQDDTLAEDVADMTADAVTAPEHASEDINGDETTEMLSALSQLTESQKTSGSTTPESHVHEVQEPDLILQEVVETICMTPSIFAITIQEKHPGELAVSHSPFVVEATTTSESKVLTDHGKEEATSVATGLFCEDICAVTKTFPMLLVQGISEASKALQTETVSGEWTNVYEAEIITDQVYEAEIQEPETKFILPEKTIMETERNSNQETPKNTENNFTPEVNECVTKVPVSQTTVQSETGKNEDDFNNKDTTSLLTKTPLSTMSEKHVCEQATQKKETFIEGKQEQDLLNVDSSVTNADPALGLVAKLLCENSKITDMAGNETVQSTRDENTASISESPSKESKITEDDFKGPEAEDTTLAEHDVIVSQPKSLKPSSSELIKDVCLDKPTEDVLISNNAESVSENTLYEAPESIKKFKDTLENELVGHSDVVLMPDSTVDSTSETPEDVIQLKPAVAVEFTDNWVSERPNASVDEDEKVTVNVLKDTLAEVIDSETHDLLAVQPIPIINNELLKEMTGFLVSNVKGPETEEPVNTVSLVSDSVKNQLETVDEVQIKCILSLSPINTTDNPSKVTEIDFDKEIRGADEGPFADIVVDICENTKVTSKDVAQHDTESKPTEKSQETHDPKLESLLEENKQKCNEKEQNILAVKANSSDLATTGESVLEEQDDSVKATINQVTEHPKTILNLDENNTTSKCSNGETDTVSGLSTNQIEEQCLNGSVHSEDPTHDDKFVENEGREVKEPNTKPQSQEELALDRFLELSLNNENLISDKVSGNVMEAPKLDDKYERSEPQETVSTFIFPTFEPQIKTQQQCENEESQATELGAIHCKEDPQVLEASVTISVQTLPITETTTDDEPNNYVRSSEEKFAECKSVVECKTAEQPDATVQHCGEEMDDILKNFSEAQPSELVQHSKVLIRHEDELVQSEVLEMFITQMPDEVISEQESDIKAEINTDPSGVTELEGLPGLYNVNVDETEVETKCKIELKEELTVSSSKGQRVTSTEMTEEPANTETVVFKPEMLTQGKHELTTDSLQMTPSKTQANVSTVVQIETATECELKKETAEPYPLETNLEKETMGITSEPQTPDAQTLITEAAEETILKTSTLASEIQTIMPLVHEQLNVLKEAEILVKNSKKDVQTQVEIEEAHLKKMTVDERSFFKQGEENVVVSAIKKENSLCIQTNTAHVSSTKQDGELGCSSLSTVHPNTVIELQEEVKSPVKLPPNWREETVLPVIQTTPDIMLKENPEIPVKASVAKKSGEIDQGSSASTGEEPELEAAPSLAVASVPRSLTKDQENVVSTEQTVPTPDTEFSESEKQEIYSGVEETVEIKCEPEEELIRSFVEDDENLGNSSHSNGGVISTMQSESLQETDDDLWEDAVDEISEDNGLP